MTDGLNGVRVLIVEDEFLLAEELRMLLENHGCIVVGPVARLENALALAREAAIDVAVLDVRIGRADSGSVAEALRARGCPFVFATGYGADDARAERWDAPVLTKPVTHRELLDQLERLTRRSRSESPPVSGQLRGPRSAR